MKTITKILLAIMSFNIVISAPTAFAQVSEADIRSVNTNSEFYAQGCNTNEAANGQINFQVSIIGDSLLEGAYAAGLNNKYIAKGYSLTDSENKWPSGKVSRNSTEGLDIIKNNATAIKNSGTVVIELGTNDKTGLLTNDGERVTNIIQSIKDTGTSAKVYWVIPYNSTMSADENASIANMLNDKAQKLQFATINWPEFVRSNNIVLDGGVHPSQNYEQYANFLVDNTTNPTKGLSIEGKCRCNSLTGEGTLPDSIPQPYHDIFIAAASQFNVEPATIATLKIKESGQNYPEIKTNGDSVDKNVWGFRNETVGGSWTAEYLSVGSENVGKTGSAGPFQFLFSTWKSQSESIGNDGNGDGKYDAENVLDSAFAAARFISELGGTKGASKDQLILAFTKYNAGPGRNTPSEYGESAYNVFEGIITEGGTSIQGTAGSLSCSIGLGVSPDGFHFPLNTTKSALKSGSGDGNIWNCAKNTNECLNDSSYQSHGYAAADIFSYTGTPVLVSRPGQVTYIQAAAGPNNRGCEAGCGISIQGEDGLSYFYGHMKGGSLRVDLGQKVNVGDVIGEVGLSSDAQDTPPHLHFDVRSEGGITCIRNDVDPRCAEIMKDPRPALVASYNNLPEN